ncbi:MAG: hypothetical protein ACK4WM_05520 [Thermoflexales bacterium]
MCSKPLSATPFTRRRLLELRALQSAAGVLSAAALAVLLFYLLVYVQYARAIFVFPFDYDQGEGFELYDGIRLLRGQNIYLDNAQFPFYSSNYPPMYRAMLVPLLALFGPHLWVGRALTFATSLVTGLVIARAIWTGTPTAPPSLRGALTALGGLSFFAANYVYHIAPLARAHLPMVMFAALGIHSLDRAFSRAQPQAWRAGLGIALLMTAGFTKLQAVDALVAGFGWLLLRQRRWFVAAFFACLAVTVGLVAWLNAVTAGQFWINVVLANVNEYDIALTWQTYAQWLRLQLVLIAGGVLHGVWDVWAMWRARSTRPLSVWSLYFLTASAMGLLTGKWGAGPAYLIASIVAGAVCTGRMLARLADRLGACHRPAGAAAMLAVSALVWLAQASLNVHLPTSGRLFGRVAQLIGVADAPSVYPPYPYFDSAGYTQLGHFPLPEDHAQGWALVEALRNVDGPVWSEEATFVLLAGKEVVTNPTQLYNLSKNAMLDTREMIALIEQRAFGAVLFRALFYPDDVKEAILRNYYWAQRFPINGFEYWLLLPIPKEEL